MFLFLANLVSSAVFGIDFGCEYIKVGMAIPGRGVHVALNQQSKRLSPSYFAMWNISNPRLKMPKDARWTLEQLNDCSWAFLDAAKSHSLRFPHNMIKGIAPIHGTINGFSRRETMALVLRHLISTVDEGRWTPETAQIVLTVEPFMSRKDRMGIVEAVKLSKATITKLIDSPTAAAMVYSLEKRTLYQDKPKTVLFIDMGASYTWAAIFQFTSGKDAPIAHELSIVTNSSLGGNAMDEALADLLIQKFMEQNKNVDEDDVNGNARLRKRFVEESRRAKELLTLNKDVDVKMEDVVDDYGLNYHLTRDEFESLIVHCNASIVDLWTRALSDANITAQDVDSIELIGGITRVPYVQEVLLQVSGMEKLNRTLNSDEAVALGAGYVGASQSSAFIVMKTKMAPFTNTNVKIVHNGSEIPLFGPTNRLNETVNYTIQTGQNGNITIYSDEDELETLYLNLPVNTSEELNMTLVFGFDDMTMPYIKKAYVNETSVPLNLTVYKPSWMLTQEEANMGTAIINRMDAILDERRRYQAIHNDYESFIYKIKDKLEYDPVYKKVVNETERVNLSTTAKDHQAWLFGDHETPLNYSILQTKLNELKDLTKPVEKRAEEYVKRAPAFNKLNNTLNFVFKELNETWPVTKPWLNETQLEKVWSTYNRTHDWFIEKYEQQRNMSDWEDPIVHASEIDTQKMLLEWSYNSTNRIKKPTPVPTPKPNITLDNTTFTDVNGTFVNQTDTNATFAAPEVNSTTPDANTTTPEVETNPPQDETPETQAEAEPEAEQQAQEGGTEQPNVEKQEL